MLYGGDKACDTSIQRVYLKPMPFYVLLYFKSKLLCPLQELPKKTLHTTIWKR